MGRFDNPLTRAGHTHSTGDKRSKELCPACAQKALAKWVLRDLTLSGYEDLVDYLRGKFKSAGLV